MGTATEMTTLLYLDTMLVNRDVRVAAPKRSPAALRL
jgi:hypothetical protein